MKRLQQAPKFPLIVGLILLFAFLITASLSPQISNKLGELAQRKKGQESSAQEEKNKAFHNTLPNYLKQPLKIMKPQVESVDGNLVTQKTEIAYTLKEENTELSLKTKEVKQELTRLSAGQGKDEEDSIFNKVIERKELIISALKAGGSRDVFDNVIDIDKKDLPSKLKGLIEEKTELTGDFYIVHVDDLNSGISTFSYRLNTPNSQHELHFREAPTHIPSAAKIKVKGKSIDREILVDSAETQSLSFTAPSGTKKIHVLPLYFKDQNYPNNNFSNLNLSKIKDYYEQRVSSHDFSPVFTFPSDGKFQPISGSWNLKDLGGDIAAYSAFFCEAWKIHSTKFSETPDYFVVLFPGPIALRGGGVASIGNNPPFACEDGTITPSIGLSNIAYDPYELFGWWDALQGQQNDVNEHNVLVHELSHNFDMLHSGGLDCQTNQICEENQGAFYEYANPFDPMGLKADAIQTSRLILPGAYHREKAGTWYKQDGTPKVLEINKDSLPKEFELTARHIPQELTTGPLAFKLRGALDNAGYVYYGEYYNPINSFNGSQYENPFADPGLIITIATPNLIDHNSDSKADSDNLLIDTTPNSKSSGSKDPELNDFLDAALSAGKAFTDSYSGIKIELVSANDQKAIVRISNAPVELPRTGGDPTTPPTNPTNLRFDSLPSCSNSLYSSTLRWATTNATTVNYQFFQGTQMLFQGSINTTSTGSVSWSQSVLNLSPTINYSWKVQAQNSLGVSGWIQGPDIKVNPCSPPPAPISIFTSSIPSCSQTSLGSVTFKAQVTNSTDAEMELWGGPNKLASYRWTNLTYGAVNEVGLTDGNTQTNVNYTWKVKMGNPAGWTNFYEKTINVPPCPDLSADIIPPCPLASGAVAPPYICSKGSTVTFNGKLYWRYSNSSSPTFNYAWYMNNTKLSESQASGIAPNGSKDVSKSYTFSNAGDYTVKLCVDTTNLVSEGDEQHNCSQLAIRVPTQNTEIDLDPCTSTAGCMIDQKNRAKTSYYPGEKITYKFNIFGTQEVPASNFWVELWVDKALNLSSDYCNQTGSKAAIFVTNISNPHSITFTAPTTTGTHRFVMIADSRGTNSATCSVPEIAEDNNWLGYTEFSVISAPLSTSDTDGDGYTNNTEKWVGTDPYDPCGENAWPADFDNDGKVNITDTTSFLAPARRLDTSNGDVNYNKRWDLVPGRGIFAKDINIQDMTSVSTVAPPMLNKVRAYGGPACPYPLNP